MESQWTFSEYLLLLPFSWFMLFFLCVNLLQIVISLFFISLISLYMKYLILIQMPLKLMMQELHNVRSKKVTCLLFHDRFWLNPTPSHCSPQETKKSGVAFSKAYIQLCVRVPKRAEEGLLTSPTASPLFRHEFHSSVNGEWEMEQGGVLDQKVSAHGEQIGVGS